MSTPPTLPAVSGSTHASESPVLEGTSRHLFLWKPAGLPVFPPHDSPDGDCLLARLAPYIETPAALPWPAGFEGGIAHRLDTGTSGVMVAARTLEALAELREDFTQHRLRKFYLFASGGRVDFTEQLVVVPLAHHPSKKDRMVWAWPDRPTPDQTPHRGKWYEARTLITRRGALWQAEIQTGVTHQVRAHAAFAKLPITGDRQYGGGPGVFRLHHMRIIGPTWRSPLVEPPSESASEPLAPP